MSLTGILSDADVRTYVDCMATLLKNMAPSLGLNLTGETLTGAYLADQCLIKIAGDGGSNPGLGYAQFQADAVRDLRSLSQRLRWDDVFSKGDLVQRCAALNNMVTSHLPTGWTLTDSTVIHPFDAWLIRINGTGWSSATLNGTPAAGSTAATNHASGGLPVSNSNEPYIVHTFVGDLDRKESLPSTPVQGAAIGNANNALTYTIATPASPPSTGYTIKIYRTEHGGSSSGPFYFAEEYDIVSGYPTMKVLKPDSLLRKDITPPGWLDTLLPYEFALLWALCFSSAGTPGSPLRKFQSQHLLSAQNVWQPPATALLSGNVLQHGLFGTYIVGTGFTAATPRRAHDATNNALGFVGALGSGTSGFQARVTSALNAAGTLTASYTYLDASLGYYGTPATATGLVSDSFSGTTVDSTANFDVPADRLVLTVSITAAGGGLTSGTAVIESQNVRSI